MALLAITAASTAPTVSAQVLVSETFNTGTTFSGWYWTGGSFQNPPTFGQAWNESSTTNQFFTTSFVLTALNIGDSLVASFQYNPNSVNINTVRVGLFSGTAASASGWNQWDDATSPSSTWTGYIGTLAIGSGNSTSSLKSASGSHPFFGAQAGSTSVAESFGTGALRAASLTLNRTAEAITLTLSEGANFDSLAPVVSYVDSTSAITNFNVFSLYFTTTELNGDIRYDTVTVEAIPEPSVFALLGAAVVFLVAARMRHSRRKAVAEAGV